MRKNPYQSAQLGCARNRVQVSFFVNPGKQNDHGTNRDHTHSLYDEEGMPYSTVLFFRLPWPR
jgi:hypothetical protein